MRPLYLISKKALVFLALLLLSSFWFYAFVSFQDYSSLTDSEAQGGSSRLPPFWSRTRQMIAGEHSSPVRRWTSAGATQRRGLNDTSSVPGVPTGNDIEVIGGVPKILVWTPFFSQWPFDHGQQSLITSDCPKACVITRNRTDLEQSAAVLFHVRDLDMTDLPAVRLASQRWVFWSMESPVYSVFSGFRFMSDMFNWTMSYRQDSDVVMNYGLFIRRPAGKGFKDIYGIWKSKTRMAVWMVSHCRTDSGREDYVDELRQYIDVDVYGRCGHHSCPKDKTKSCFKDFEKRYMFVLALENAVCKDYATEKFYNALNYDMVPVVLGGANYSKIAPPNSFIDALSFSSPAELASYLVQVSKDFSLYRSHLEWKNDYEIVPWEESFCYLCGKIHSSRPEQHSVYSDMVGWWVTEGRCRTWREK